MKAIELIEDLLECDLDREVLIPDSASDEYKDIKSVKDSSKFIYLDFVQDKVARSNIARENR